MTTRETARQNVIEEVTRRAELEHERNYYKLHVRRDGSVDWTESINRSDDIIDDEAEGFHAVPSVACVGTGSYACNCDHCNEVYDADEEQAAKDEGREYKADEKYKTQSEAISDAVANSDLSELEEAMVVEFERIPAGYFSDETADEDEEVA